MKLSGFSFVRNGFQYGVPFLESILSILPVCDEFIIAVGDSSDGTREAIADLKSEKIKIIDTVWNDELRKGGKIFAQQTNIALDAISGEWAFHLQADEVIHENDLPKILQAIQSEKDSALEGFILPFLHFWGDYKHVRDSRRMHRFEVRLFRNDKLVRSYRDSQGFRKYQSLEGYLNGTDRGEKLKVKKIDAPVFHYTGVRDNHNIAAKNSDFMYYYGKEKPSENAVPAFDYNSIDRVKKFTAPHPKVMQEKIKNYAFEFVHDKSKAKWKTKDRLIQPLEDLIHYRFGEYKNYILQR